MPEGVEFPSPSLLFYEGRTYGQPEVVRISLPQVDWFALTLAGLFCRRGFQPDSLMPQEGTLPEGHIPCRLLCTGHSYAEGAPAEHQFP